MNLALVASTVLAVGVSGFVVKHALQDAGPDEAKSAVNDFMSAIGEPIQPTKLRVLDRVKADLYTVGFDGASGNAVSFFVYRKGATVILFDDGDRQDQLRKGLSLTERRAFADKADAERRAKELVAQLKLPYEVSLVDSTFEQNEWGTKKKSGRASFRFLRLVEGYKFIDRECGVRFAFDVETGKLLRYNRYLERMFAPVPCDLPATTLTASETWHRYNPTNPQPPTVKIGWVQPKGSQRARLCYSFESPMGETTTASQVFVDAETATRVDH